MNVEALAVGPGGAMTLATKSPSGDTVVYSVPARPDATTVRAVRRIGAFQVPTADGPFGGGSLLGLLVTGAAISPGGDRLVLRTYTNAYEWALKSGDVAAALRHAPGPRRVAGPASGRRGDVRRRRPADRQRGGGLGRVVRAPTGAPVHDGGTVDDTDWRRRRDPDECDSRAAVRATGDLGVSKRKRSDSCG